MKEYIKIVKQKYKVDDAEYFLNLNNGSFNKEDFIETQIQFLFAVVNFSRPMSILASRLPRPETRMSTLKNVMEEHGDGSISYSHESTFLAFLSKMGVTAEYIELRALWPATQSFNNALGNISLCNDLYTAVAAFGVVEDLFSYISHFLGQTVVNRNWLKPSELAHYNNHKKLDVKHAENFYQIIRPLYGAGDDRVDYLIEQGLELGAYTLMTLYQELYRYRTHRWTRKIRGPHSLADGWYLNADLYPK